MELFHNDVLYTDNYVLSEITENFKNGGHLLIDGKQVVKNHKELEDLSDQYSSITLMDKKDLPISGFYRDYYHPQLWAKEY